MVRKVLIVEGMVQGVGWRYHCLKCTENFQVTGYVINESNGNVRIVIEGKEKEVENFIDYLKNSNYPGYVKEWKIENSVYTGEFRDFRIRY